MMPGYSKQLKKKYKEYTTSSTRVSKRRPRVKKIGAKQK